MATNEEIDFMYGIGEAVKRLRPNAVFTLYNRDFIEWEDSSGSSPPDWDEVLQQFEQDKAEFERTQYIRDRKQEYGNAANQLDAIYDLIASGISLDQNSEWFKQVKSIKDKYPKPV